ncbi:MAG TPA: hypothetical protein EYH38_03580 [Leucothrix sp.]|nr:hypothetical protein [Leucothrix sp.]
MKVDLNQSEINRLEDVLINFKNDWELQQSERATKWRFYFLLSFLMCVLVSIYLPSFWWLNIIVVGYFAGSLFTMLRQRVKISQQIIEHQKQLRLVRLLRKFEASPYSKKE